VAAKVPGHSWNLYGLKLLYWVLHIKFRHGTCLQPFVLVNVELGAERHVLEALRSVKGLGRLIWCRESMILSLGLS